MSYLNIQVYTLFFHVPLIFPNNLSIGLPTISQQRILNENLRNKFTKNCYVIIFFSSYTVHLNISMKTK